MDWTTLQRRATFSASAVVLLGGAFVVYQFIAARVGAKPFDLTQRFGFTIADSRHRVASPQSPVRVVGGSIKLKEADNGWVTTWSKQTCATAFHSFTGHIIQSCVVSADMYDYSSVGLEFVDVALAPTSGLDATWKITALARGVHEIRGVDICVIYNSACVTAPGSGVGTQSQIAIASFDNTPYNAVTRPLPSTLISEQVDTSFYRYHDPDYKGEPNNQLEYMGLITVTVSGMPYYSRCFDGLCRIDIGN